MGKIEDELKSSIVRVDGSDLFSSNSVISTNPGAFPYDATFTFDLTQINATDSVYPALAVYAGEKAGRNRHAMPIPTSQSQATSA